MITVCDPGTYTIKLNDCGKPSLYGANGTTPIDDPQFESSGNASFFFQILERSLISFDPERPITWGELGWAPEPPGNSHHVVTEVSTLILNVTPAMTSMMPVSTRYHFTLHFNVGGRSDVLWKSDGSKPLDPTIVENPPNG